MRLAIAISGTLSACVATPLFASESGRIGVTYEETRTLDFTRPGSGDIVSVQHLGDDCLSTIVVYTIRRADDGFPILTKALPIGIGDPISTPEFSSLYESCERFHGVDEAFWRIQEEAIIDDSLEFVPSEMRDSVIIHVEQNVWNQSRGAQLFCISEGYESTSCYGFDSQQKSAILFLSYGL